MATSTDGIHFGLGKQTALTNPVEVRRMVPPARAAIDSGESGALPAFVATMTLRSNATGPWHGKPIAYFATATTAFDGTGQQSSAAAPLVQLSTRLPLAWPTRATAAARVRDRSLQTVQG